MSYDEIERALLSKCGRTETRKASESGILSRSGIEIRYYEATRHIGRVLDAVDVLQRYITQRASTSGHGSMILILRVADARGGWTLRDVNKQYVGTYIIHVHVARACLLIFALNHEIRLPLESRF